MERERTSTRYEPAVRRTSSRRKFANAAANVVCRAAAYVVLAIFAAFVFYVVRRAWPVLSWEFLTAPPRGGMLEGGISTCIYGTVALLALAAVFALPVGVAAAVYLNESAAGGRAVNVIRAAINNLAGVPSIVFGLFGLAFFVTFLRFGASLLAAAATLAVMVLPVVIFATEEALKAVPRSFRLGAAALGATRWQTTSRVVLPQATSGIITGLVLAVGRAAGETAPILFTGAAFYLPYLPEHPRQQFMELSYHIFAMATQSSDVTKSAPIAFGTTLTLLLVVFAFNLTGVIWRARLRSKRVW